MFSLNVPLPGRVAALAADLHPALMGFESVRDDHTLVCKRFGSPEPHEIPNLEERTRRALAGLGPFEARTNGIDAFDNPVNGDGPVVYLAVESPGLYDAHRRLVDAFDAVPDLEGEDYVPHVTLARDGDPDDVRRLRATTVGPVTWTVTELAFFDATYGERTSTVSLPA